MKRRTRKKKLRGGSNIRLGILAQFKNEEMVLKEWIDHYLWQGADTIVLLNNNSSDNFRHITDQYKDKVFVLDAPKNHAQPENYNLIGLPELKKHKVDVMAILDIDEYVFGTDGQNMKQHIVEIFGKPDRPSQIKCKWKMFGSSGHNKHPTSIRKSFTKREKGIHRLFKSITWLNDVKRADIHESPVSGKTIDCPAGLELNHYSIMSKEYFEKVKMTRGNVVDPNKDKFRNWKYFEDYNRDANEVNTKLADLVGGQRAA
jgi:Glycosyl transferase family 2